MPPKKKSSTPAKKPSAKSVTKKPKRKILSTEEMFPFEAFPFRLEYQDGNENRICHFQCEDHRIKYIKRYGLKKNQHFCDNKND